MRKRNSDSIYPATVVAVRDDLVLWRRSIDEKNYRGIAEPEWDGGRQFGEAAARRSDVLSPPEYPKSLILLVVSGQKSRDRASLTWLKTTRSLMLRKQAAA